MKHTVLLAAIGVLVCLATVPASIKTVEASSTDEKKGVAVLENNSGIVIDGQDLLSEERFHRTFSSAMGFPEWYGRNFNAWVDVMTSLREGEDNLTNFSVEPNGVFLISIRNYDVFAKESPDLALMLNELVALVNVNEDLFDRPPLLALAYARGSWSNWMDKKEHHAK